jgi:hypothetical protein
VGDSARASDHQGNLIDKALMNENEIGNYSAGLKRGGFLSPAPMGGL